MKNKRQLITYKDDTGNTTAERVRRHNKSVSVIRYEDAVSVEFHTIDGILKPRAKHMVLKNKVVNTAFNMSREAAEDLYVLLGRYLQTDSPKEKEIK